MLVLFCLSVLMVAYIYVGYPLMITIAGILLKARVRKDAWEPKVSILIAAFNEAEHIQKTLENKLALDYPPDRLEIIVISDSSDDETDSIVSAYEGRVRLIRQEPRAGKTAALNLAVPEASGQILVFSDANSIYDPNALKHLINNFADPNVGYVTGKMVYSMPDGTVIGDGCSAYMKYENYLREVETKCGSIVGVDGGIDAVRKELYCSMKPDQLPDFVLPLNVFKQGYRVIYEKEALLKEETLKSSIDEYRMRVRVALRAMWALYDMRKLLSIRQYGFFSIQLWSHKVLRYACFIFLFLAYVTNLNLLTQGGWFILFFGCQTLLYLAFFTYPFLEKMSIRSKIAQFSYYFCLLNLASAHAFLKFVQGKKQVLWTPRKG